jgi:hypothetical protein
VTVVRAPTADCTRSSANVRIRGEARTVDHLAGDDPDKPMIPMTIGTQTAI